LVTLLQILVFYVLMFYLKHLIRREPTFVLFQLITCTQCNSLPIMQTVLYSLTRGCHFRLNLVKTCANMCKTTSIHSTIYDICTKQPYFGSFYCLFINKLTKKDYNADDSGFDCNAVQCVNTIYVYFEGLT
jgi:hypothetical protein